MIIESDCTNATLQIIDRTIKELWLNDIYKDYCTYSLLKEDSLKNAFYYHLRRRLTDEFLLENNLRIYTEFYTKGIRADLVIAKLNENPAENGHLQNGITDILAIVEMKYKYDLNDKPFKEDIRKIKNYIKTFPYTQCQYYLAFIHEVIYEHPNYSWLSAKDITWANGRLTELNGYYTEDSDAPVWTINSYNKLNSDLSIPVKSKSHLIKERRS